MKKLVFILALVLCSCLKVFSQATSLTVDCQTPGWLSSMIPYGNQLTLENIKITGYINGTDFKFIRELNLNRNLKGCIDLEDANIVSGGESYGGSDGYYYPSTTTQDNILTDYIFAYLNPLRKVILPHSLVGFSSNMYAFHFLRTRVDTLVINGSMKNLFIGSAHDNKYWSTRCIYFPDSLETINFGYISSGELFFPATLKEVRGKRVFDDVTIHCKSTNPESIIFNRNDGWSADADLFYSGVIYVPEGTTEKYQKSIFHKLTIIEDIPVSGIKINPLSHHIYSGDDYTFTAEVLPENAINKDISWKSSNENIASINDQGLLLAKEAGRIWIKAFSTYYGLEDSLLVDIYDHTTGIVISDNSIKLRIGSSYNLQASTLPLDTSDGQIEWNTSNKMVASVDKNGIVKAIGKGICTITAKSMDGTFNANCEVTVIQPVETVTLDKRILNLKVGETDRIYSQITPTTADNKAVIWSSSDEQIAQVNNNGDVSAIKAGVVWIKATSEDNTEAKDSCKVTVLQSVNGITLNHNTYQLNGIGESFSLEAIVSPDDASNKEVNWKSSNESVCIVSNGTVVAVGEGTCVIIATSVDGGYIATCVVTVTNTNGVSLMENDGDLSFQIYDVKGVKCTNFKKGINIIRFVDGTMKKIQIK